jgi:hypothetical protein
MIGIYLLITIFGQISSQNPLLAPDLGPAEVTVAFQKLSGISVGTPVVAEGELIGTVSSVSSTNKRAEAAGSAASEKNTVSDASNPGNSSPPYEVHVKIAPRHRNLIRHGTVALIASPLSTTRVQLETVVELLIPTSADSPLHQDGDLIRGYSSYEEFWSAGVNGKGQRPALPN